MPTETLTTYVTAEEYLERERAATETKSEWIDGEVREMVGASFHHVAICGNLVALFHAALRGRAWAVLPNDMKIRIPSGPYFYPDVSVVPDPPTFEDERTDVVLDPVVIVEILSPSTERLDRGRKLDDYRRLSSLRDYLLVDQFQPRIHHYQRDGDVWVLRTAIGLGASVSVPSVDCVLSLADVYDRIVTDE